MTKRRDREIAKITAELKEQIDEFNAVAEALIAGLAAAPAELDAEGVSGNDT